MKPLQLTTLLPLLIFLALPIEGFAQAGVGNTGAAGRQQPGEDVLTRDTLSQADLKRLAEQIDQWNRVDAKKGIPPRVARERASAMLGVLQVSCAVTEAAYRGQAPDAGGAHVYEAACEDGMGYLLMLRGSALTGASCLEDRAAASPTCALPANAGRVMVGAVLSRHQIPCKVRDYKWLGTSVSGLDHVEAACEGGTGYVMRSPPPGVSGKLEVFNCQDAIKQGIACKLTPVSSPAADSRPTLAWFKEALTRYGVSCESKRARIIGRESIKRRYLVEFECADHPDGLVAYVPPAGDMSNSFETMNCAAAAEKAIRCELNGAGASASKTPR